MSKNKFKEIIKQYLYLAEDSTLDKTDKFAKVRPLFDAKQAKSAQPQTYPAFRCGRINGALL